VTGPQRAAEPSLAEILGGRRAAFDAGLPAMAFVTAWAILRTRFPAGSTDPVIYAAAASVVVGVVLAIIRLARGKRPAAVVLGLLGVVAAALIVLRTGRAQDFFLLQIASNAASALLWTASIVIRWPLLGVIVGFALRQRTSWRADPDLLRGYGRASWIWVAQYLVRLAVFVPLFLSGAIFALGVARLLTWVPAVICIGLSWPVLRSALPSDHPGIRYPRVSTGGIASQQ
jgi:hypothetical protein